MNAVANSSWAGWNSSASLYSSRASARGGDDDAKSTRGDEDTRSIAGSVRTQDEIPLFGPEMPGSDHGSMRELYENRYKLLRDDNQMLRENLRREQQAREDIARLMREECAELAKRVKEANEAKNAAEAKIETELQDVRTLRITNRELSEACERRAATIDELRGRLELAEQRLDQAEEGKKRSNEMISALEAACTEMRTQLDTEKGSKSEKELELNKHIAQLIEQTEQLKTDAGESSRLQQVVTALENRLTKQEQDLRASLEEEFQQRTKMLAQDHSDKMMQQLAKMNKLEAEYASLQQEYSDLQHSSDMLRAKLVTVSEELQRQSEGTDADSSDLKTQMRYLQNQLELQNEQILTLSKEQESAHEVVSRLQQTNVDLIAQRNSLEARLMQYTDNKDTSFPLGYSENHNTNAPAPPSAPATALSDAGSKESEHLVFRQQSTMQRGSPPKGTPYQGVVAVKASPMQATVAAVPTMKAAMPWSPPQGMPPQQQLMQKMYPGVAMSPQVHHHMSPQIAQAPQPQQAQYVQRVPMQSPMQPMQSPMQPGQRAGAAYGTPQQTAVQRAAHEMSYEEVAQAGFDPNSVIGC